MNLNKTLGRVATTFVAATMLAAFSAVPASAEPIVATDVTFTQTLDMTAAPGAGLPNVTISYDVSTDGITDSGIVKTGVGEPSIDDVTFTGNPENGVYKSTATVDFSDVTFTTPGVYRYKITRDYSDSTSVSASDSDVRYLDVYVGWNDYDDEVGVTVPGNAELVIYNYVLVTDAEQIPGTDGNYPGGMGAKSNGYENAYATTSLKLTKNVTGAMGNKSEDFSFDITLTDCETASVDVSINDGEAFTYPSNATINLDDVISSGENILVTGLPVGTVYTVEETDASGYEISFTGATQDSNNKAKATGTIVNGNNEVTVTNNRNAVSPTGIVMNVAPYVLLVVVAAAGCFVFLRKRRED